MAEDASPGECPAHKGGDVRRPRFDALEFLARGGDCHHQNFEDAYSGAEAYMPDPMGQDQ